MTQADEPTIKLHSPSATEPFGEDWTDWLAEIGASETISSSSWASTPSGLTLASASIVTGSKKTQIKVSGGVVGTRYEITNTISSSSGYTDNRTFYLLVVKRFA